MSTDPFDPYEQELITAALLVAEAAASRLAALSVTSGARIVRVLFPTAATLLIRADPLSPGDHAVDVTLIEIHDVEGDRLWSAETGGAPRAPGVRGGWSALSTAVQTRLAEALAHATPRQCGWRSQHAESDTEDPQDLSEHGDLYLVHLPTQVEIPAAVASLSVSG